MEQRVLGTSGLTVSSLALGTMTFGAETDETGSFAQLDRFVESGGTFIDTADVYSAGRSEEIIGRWLARRGHHDDLVIATKGRFPMGDGPLDRGAGRRHLQRAVHASLRRLGVDVVDLYQVHGWDQSVPLEETLQTLDDLVRSGTVRYVGLSNYTGWQLQRALRLAEMHGWTAPVSLQPQYNLLAREIEWEIVPQCIEEGLGLLPWSPLGGGWLTGKYRRDERPTGSTRLGEDPERGVEAYDRRNTERTWEIIDRVRSVADAHGSSLGQVALAWVRQRPSVSSVILGARTVEQLDDNLASVDVTLSAEEMDELSVVSAPGIADYPYRMLARQCGMSVWDELRTRPAPD
ncbi:MAG TPA: aldo/keto reductase [Ilumatobacteraceae bacterium]|nr:aldo/keto reductase [Ilumatobacteraceae bacterium]